VSLQDCRTFHSGRALESRAECRRADDRHFALTVVPLRTTVSPSWRWTVFDKLHAVYFALLTAQLRYLGP
jgi:hypothetical protein